MPRRLLTVVLLLAATLAVAPAAHAANGTISGHVAGPNGTALTGASFNVRTTSGSYVTGGAIQPDGSYSVSVLPGDYTMFFFAADGSDLAPEYYHDAPTISTATVVHVADSGTTTVNETLAAGATLSGRVVAANGSPVVGATVEALGPTALRTATTGSDGRYTVKGLSAGSYKLRFVPKSADNLIPEFYDDQPSMDAATAVPVPATGDTALKDVVLDPGATISGTVTRAADGAALAGAGVSVLQNGSSVATGQTKADGTYTVSGLRPGSYQVYFQQPSGSALFGEFYDNARQPADATAVTLTAGQARGGVNAALEGEAIISGVVKDTQGNPVANGTVTVYGANGSQYGPPASTDGSGAYQVRGLPAGTYRVRFAPAAGVNLIAEYFQDKPTLDAADPITLAYGQTTTANAVLAAGATISGKVTGSGNAAVGGVTVTVSSAQYTATGTTSGSGDYTVPGLPAGTYTVCFAPPANASLDLAGECYDDKDGTGDPVTIAAGDNRTSVNASLMRGGHITGKVTSSSGAGVSGVQVAVVRANAQFAFPSVTVATTDANGDYTATNLSTGAYKVLFTPPSGSGLATEFYDDKTTLADATVVNVTRAQDRTGVSAVLETAGTISGKVTGDDGGLASVFVSATPDAGGSTATVSTNGDGTYSLTGLRPGTYRLKFTPGPGPGSAYRPEFYSGKASLAAADPVTVTSGGTATANARLTRPVSVSGTVKATGGGALKGVAVTLYDAGGAKVDATQTDGDGHYAFSEAPGAYRVGYTADGYVSEFFDDKATLAAASVLTLTSGQSATADAGLDEPKAEPTQTVTPIMTASPTATASPAPTAAPAQTAKLTSAKKLSVKGGRFSVKLACGSAGCRVKIVARVKRGKKTRKVTIASGAAGPGGGTVKLKLSAAGRKLIARHAAKVTAVVTPKGEGKSTSATLTLRRKT